jgi:hypothetical protein
VYGLDDELLEMVPKPVLAVLFLFPYKSSVILFILSSFILFITLLLLFDDEFL